MPLVDFNDQATWDSLYEAHVGGAVVHYARAAARSYYGIDIVRLLTAIDIAAGSSVAVIGAAFGWGVEAMIAAGLQAVAIDTSTWIAQNIAGNAEVQIHSADVLTADGRAVLGRFDWAITEDVLPALSDAEAAAMSAACRLIAPKVAHLVMLGPGGDARLNWKTAAEWKAIVGADIIVPRGSGEAL